jgi:thiamine phosphate synthase YjbQ (UPF0047 family)
MVFTQKFDIATKGQGDAHDVTRQVAATVESVRTQGGASRRSS